jgi:hypothetical protein
VPALVFIQSQAAAIIFGAANLHQERHQPVRHILGRPIAPLKLLPDSLPDSSVATAQIPEFNPLHFVVLLAAIRVIGHVGTRQPSLDGR